MSKTKLSSLLCLLSLVVSSSVCKALNNSSDVKVQPIVKTTKSWDGKPLVYPKGQAEITGLIITIAPGGRTGWHLHPVPSFGMVAEGHLVVTLKDGRQKYFKAGDGLAEVVNTLHNGRNVGKGYLKLIVFYAGAKGQKLTVVEPSSSKKESRSSIKTK